MMSMCCWPTSMPVSDPDLENKAAEMLVTKTATITLGQRQARRGISRLPLWLAVLAALFSTATMGAEKKGDSDIVQTLNKAQGMLRQLSQQKAELEARTADLEKQIEDAKKTMEEQTKQLAAKVKEIQVLQADVKHKADIVTVLEKNNGILKNNNEILKTNLEKLKQQYGEQNQALQEQARRLSTELTANQQDNALLVHAVKERSEWIEKCTRQNGQLIKINKDILDHFRDKSFWESLQDAEPLTGIASVAKENKIEDYRYRLNDLRVTPWKDKETGY